MLIDDLEYNRKDQAEQIFQRYRQILDSILSEEQQQRASVHFLVNMIEATILLMLKQLIKFWVLIYLTT